MAEAKVMTTKTIRADEAPVVDPETTSDRDETKERPLPESLRQAKERDYLMQTTKAQREAADRKPTRITLATGTVVTVPADQADAMKRYGQAANRESK